ncbi:LysR family transcriptional regulator of abg operon [Buttiauxella sp. BIGb0471]|uniref:LysR substrate-binding domain-containing protein n=1 Tax=Buttiauxella sp. BIGb0471 TaxID=2940597 RepID=UPI0021688569|nr:LysR substrate-binding domain-containing protein [Buttiauxella sp. BIGb0471]MCS3601169.1 LysR family transcriptional regulator of abg operon [Buttiauxella sp. BIGb0471]
MSNLPKINQLKNLRAIIQYGSIRAASQAVHQTQSAMTRSIQELEKTLGVTLLDRTARGALLTDMGRLFEPRMNMVLNELERAVDEIRQLESAANGTVMFGCSHLPAFGIMPGLLKKFQERHPKAYLTVIEGQLSELLGSLRLGRMDFFIGIVTPDIALHEFSEEHLSVAKFCVFAHKDHPLAHCQSLLELRDAKWYLPTASAGFFNAIEQVVFPGGKGPGCSVLYGDSTTIAEQLILTEGYLSVGPQLMLELPWLKDKLCQVNVKETLPNGNYSLIYRQQQTLTPIAKLLINEIRHEFIK